MSPISENSIQFPRGLSGKNLLSAGMSGYVVHLNAAVKFPSFSGPSHLDREARVYERLGSDHKGFLTYYGRLGDALILQYASKGSIRAHFVNKRSPVDLERRLRWAKQLASALQFVHEKEVVHADVSCNNAFLDEDWNVKLGDFAGSVIDEEPPLSLYETSHTRPGDVDASIEGDIFALGSTYYEIMTGVKPYQDLDHCQIEEAYSQGHFPDLTSVPALGNIITRCWTGQYQSVKEVLRDVQAEIAMPMVSPARPSRAGLIESPPPLFWTLALASLLPAAWILYRKR